MKNKQLFTIFLAIFLLIVGIKPSKAGEIDNHKVKYLIDKGWVQGHENGELALDENITRAQFTKMVVLISGLEDEMEKRESVDSQFSDLSNQHWAKDYINLGVGYGLLQGYPDGTFQPDSNITYGEILTILSRLNPAFNEGENTSELWYMEYVNFAIDQEYLLGLEDLDYEEPGIREEVFEIIYNYFQSVGENFTIDDLDITYKSHRPYEIAISGNNNIQDGETEVVESKDILEINHNLDVANASEEKKSSVFTYDKDIIDAVFEQASLNLLNDLRADNGRGELLYSNLLQEGADKRASELMDHGSIRVDGIAHVRPDGRKYTTAFEYLQVADNHLSYIGENLAMVSNLSVSKEMSSSDLANKIANIFFEGWKNSPNHFENMLSGKFTKVSHSIELKAKKDPNDPDRIMVYAIGVQTYGNFKNLINSSKINLQEKLENADLRVDLKVVTLDDFVKEISNIDFEKGQCVAIKMSGFNSKSIADIAYKATGIPMMVRGEPNGYMILEKYDQEKIDKVM